MKKRVSCELPRETAGKFKEFCRENGIHYEPSECYNLIHFECMMDEFEIDLANVFIDRNC